MITIAIAWDTRLKLYAESNKLRAEGDKLYAEGNKLCAEGNIQFCAAVIAQVGNVAITWQANGDCVVCGVTYKQRRKAKADAKSVASTG